MTNWKPGTISKGEVVYTKVGEATGKTLYSYDRAYWFSTREAAKAAAEKLTKALTPDPN